MNASKEEMLEAIDEFINKEYPLSCAYNHLPAIRSLIAEHQLFSKAEYLLLKVKYDALRGMVEEWRERACRCFSDKTIPALGQADVFHKGLAREFIRDIRDFKEEQDAKL